MDFVPGIGQDMSYDNHAANKMSQDVQDIQRLARSGKTERQKMQDAADNFESMFVNLLMQQMRKTIPKSELIDGGQAQEIFEDMFYQEISKRVSKSSSLGLSELLMKEFQRHTTKPEPETIREVTNENQ